MRALLLLLGCLSAAIASEAATHAVLAPENVLPTPASNPDWRELFAELSQPKNRFSRFEERRHFPFREQPVLLQGEIRIVPKRGLSLSYGGAKPHVIIIDEKGVLMRDERGRERSAPDDGRARAATAALAAILRFDLAALEQDFVIHGVRDQAQWTLGFASRDPAFADLLGAIVVQGRDATVERIEMVKSEQQRIEILLKNSQADVIFPMDVLQRFFR